MIYLIIPFLILIFSILYAKDKINRTKYTFISLLIFSIVSIVNIILIFTPLKDISILVIYMSLLMTFLCLTLSFIRIGTYGSRIRRYIYIIHKLLR